MYAAHKSVTVRGKHIFMKASHKITTSSSIEINTLSKTQDCKHSFCLFTRRLKDRSKSINWIKFKILFLEQLQRKSKRIAAAQVLRYLNERIITVLQIEKDYISKLLLFFVESKSKTSG